MIDITTVRVSDGASPEEGTGLSASPEPKVSAASGFDPSRVADLVIERAEQACRYVAKHNEIVSAGVYRNGFEDACRVCEQAIRDQVMRHLKSDLASYSVSDEQPKAEDPEGLSPQGASAARRETPKGAQPNYSVHDTNIPLPSAGANEREPREDEVEAVARALQLRDFGGVQDQADDAWGEVGVGEPDDYRDTYRRTARAAIKALDEYRAAEAPPKKEDR